MEEIKSFEKQESAEQRLIRLLKEKGTEDPETRELLDAWTREQEERIEEGNDPAAKIEFNFKRARLYFDAGYVEEALENLEADRMEAWNENREELYEAIMAEMDMMERGLEK
ncbi:MAG: hypothetical protein HYV51_02660 [Parcubacteria group bacterium]|nr:hypothetical protein [Parcubacteria group bacterium]